jgi:hypothetical protein
MGANGRFEESSRKALAKRISPYLAIAALAALCACSSGNDPEGPGEAPFVPRFAGCFTDDAMNIRPCYWEDEVLHELKDSEGKTLANSALVKSSVSL